MILGGASFAFIRLIVGGIVLRDELEILGAR